MTRRQVTLALLAAWSLIWLASFVVPPLQEPTGDGFTRALNRIGIFVGLQAMAGLIGAALFAIRPRTGKLRRLALVPGTLAILLVTAILTLALWLWLKNANDTAPRPILPTTQIPKDQPREVEQ